MRNRYLMAGIALAALTPSMASAATCEQQRSGRIAATVGGGAVGALLGTAIAGKGDNTEGAIIGGVIGAVAGNQIAKPSRDNDCRYAYGWYDKQGRWHATRVRASEARGYYDRNGDWVAGRPTGYYDGDRWMAYSGDVSTYGYTDSNGYYVPANAYGYYDANDQWQTGYASGYYDSRGRWVAGPVRGYYDSRGRWVNGNPPYGSDAASWSSVQQPGYWENGRWVSGTTYGYYDSRGRWVRSDRYGNQTGGDRWADDNWNDYPTNLDQRITYLRDRVQRMEDRGRLSRADERYTLDELSRIEYQHQAFMRDGRLNAREEATIRNRLDRLSDRLRAARQSSRN